VSTTRAATMDRRFAKRSHIQTSHIRASSPGRKPMWRSVVRHGLARPAA
jgi:hypothetical protein